MWKCILYYIILYVTSKWCHFLCSGAQVGPCSAHSVQTPFQHQWHQHQSWQLQQVRDTGNTKTISCSESLPSSSILCVCVCSLLSRSSSYTRRLNSQSSAEVSAPNPSLPRSSSYGRKLDDPSVTSVTTATSGLSRLSNLVAQRCVCLRSRVIWLCLCCIRTIWCLSQVGSRRGRKEGARLEFCNHDNHIRRARDQTETQVSVWWFPHDRVLINLHPAGKNTSY